MSAHNLAHIGFVILAAGRGTRLGCTDMPKVMLEIGGKPVVSYIVETLERAGVSKEHIMLVVGFKKETVKDFFKECVQYAEQKEQLGTAHAAYTGIVKLPRHISQVVIMSGDDSAFYTRETLEQLVRGHEQNKSTFSALTSHRDNPTGLGRVIRDTDGTFLDILEKEEISEDQKKISEVNTATYCVDRKWFEKVFPSFENIPGLEEIGMNETITAAKKEGVKIQAIQMANNDEWFGINTKEELEEANSRKSV